MVEYRTCTFAMSMLEVILNFVNAEGLLNYRHMLIAMATNDYVLVVPSVERDIPRKSNAILGS